MILQIFISNSEWYVNNVFQALSFVELRAFLIATAIRAWDQGRFINHFIVLSMLQIPQGYHLQQAIWSNFKK